MDRSKRGGIQSVTVIVEQREMGNRHFSLIGLATWQPVLISNAWHAYIRKVPIDNDSSEENGNW